MAARVRVLVCGSREWTDGAAIRGELATLPAGSVVIHGGARGADRLAGAIARGLGLEVLAYPADWERHGKAAGYVRNRQMLNDGRPELVLAYPLGESRGTWDMIARATAAGVTVRVWGAEEGR